jgi:hypothetical protein
MWLVNSTFMCFKQASTPYGDLLLPIALKHKDGGATNILVCNPFAMLHKAMVQGGSFSDFMKLKLHENQPSPERPWTLVLYADEVVPGDVMSSENRRKIWVVYASFLEFGLAALSREESWFTIMCERTSIVSSLSAGISQVMRYIVKLFFGLKVHDFKHSGMLLNDGQDDGWQMRLWVDMGIFLQDGGAHKIVWHCTGDKGTKMCMKCINLYAEESGILDEEGTDMLTCSLLHEEDLHMARDVDIRGTIGRLTAYHATDTAEDFKLRQQALGFRYEPEGILMDADLLGVVRPATQYMHDWMHAVVVNGSFNTIIYVFFEALMLAGVDVYDRLHEYIKLYTWPKRVSGNADDLAGIFGAKRKKAHRKAKHLKCNASECITLYPVIALFISTVVLGAGLCVVECQTFLALCNLMDLLCGVARSIVGPNDLKAAVRIFLDLCVEAGWRSFLHPKFHWLVHMGPDLEWFGCLLTCWVQERKHRMVKRYGQLIVNTKNYEKSVLGEVVCQHLSDLKKPGAFDFSPGLVVGTSRAAPKKVKTLLESELGLQGLELECRAGGISRIDAFEVVHKSDVVLVKSTSNQPAFAGQVLLHAEYGKVPLTIVSVWAVARRMEAATAIEWHRTNQRMLIPTSDIMGAVIYCKCADNVVRTLIPLHLRNAMFHP